MKNIKILDVTLRDGGCVNNFNFGKRYMDMILYALNNSGIDYIELGYIDENNGTECGRTQYSNEKVIYQNFLTNKNDKVKYLAMIDHGKFNPYSLEEYNIKGIDGIRYCFHKKDRKNVIPILKHLVSLGYEVYAQPMITMRYSEYELIDFLSDISSIEGIKGVYIVDSFGEMKQNDVNSMFKLFDSHLPSKISLGYHSHNNLQLSFSNAISFIQHDTDRTIMIDSSVLGMGKGAGNLNTELILDHLNTYYQSNYNIKPLLALIDKVINKIKSDYYWGYSIPFFLSSQNHCTPSYAAFFDNKNMLSVEQLSELLSLIDENKRISFDKNYAEILYEKYNERNSINDECAVNKLLSIFRDRNVLLIAPGSSIMVHKKEIEDLVKSQNIISIFVNVQPNIFEFGDYVIVCRDDALRNLNTKASIIATSNVQIKDKVDYLLDYKRWVFIEDSIVRDSGLVVSLNLLSELHVKKVYLAGFDGYSIDYKENYFDESLSKAISKNASKQRNDFAKKFINKKSMIINIEFVTHSLYEE